MIVDCAVYEDGERRAGDLDLEQAARVVILVISGTLYRWSRRSGWL